MICSILKDADLRQGILLPTLLWQNESSDLQNETQISGIMQKKANSDLFYIQIPSPGLTIPAILNLENSTPAILQKHVLSFLSAEERNADKSPYINC